MKRKIAGRVAESILLVPMWVAALGFLTVYMACSVSRDMWSSFITIWRE